MKLPSGWIFIPYIDGTTIKIKEKELVTCKDCVNAIPGDSVYTVCYCKSHGSNVGGNEFCSRSGRKDGDTQ